MQFYNGINDFIGTIQHNQINFLQSVSSNYIQFNGQYL